jgi:hypothetical protein
MPTSKGPRRLKPPCFVELSDLKDLARLACAFEKIPIPVFSFESGNNAFLATQVDVFMGRPIFYYAKSGDMGQFLGYKNSGGVEEVLPSDSPLYPAYIYAPIIHLKELPRLFQKGLGMTREKMEKLLPIQVKDIASLARIVSYKVLFEEPPLPLFFFKFNDENILGAFTRVDEIDENSLFFYLIMNEPPPNNFLKYSVLRVGEVGFTNRVDEHGNIYIKIIRLAGNHPLVELER